MSNFTYENLSYLERSRFQALVRAMVDGDCLSLVDWVGNKAPDLYEDLKNTWPSDGKIVFYEDAFAILMKNNTLKTWVTTAKTPEFA